MNYEFTMSYLLTMNEDNLLHMKDEKINARLKYQYTYRPIL